MLNVAFPSFRLGVMLKDFQMEELFMWYVVSLWNAYEIIPNFFQAFSFQLLKLENLQRWSFFSFMYNRSSIMNYFILTSHHFTPHERYELNKLTSLPMCGFTAQLVEHRIGIAEVTGSNPVEVLTFSGFFLPIAQIGKKFKFTSYWKFIEWSRPIRFFILSLMYNKWYYSLLFWNILFHAILKIWEWYFDISIYHFFKLKIWWRQLQNLQEKVVKQLSW